jgi:hypothetical protein
LRRRVFVCNEGFLLLRRIEGAADKSRGHIRNKKVEGGKARGDTPKYPTRGTRGCVLRQRHTTHTHNTCSRWKQGEGERGRERREMKKRAAHAPFPPTFFFFFHLQKSKGEPKRVWLDPSPFVCRRVRSPETLAHSTTRHRSCPPPPLHRRDTCGILNEHQRMEGRLADEVFMGRFLSTKNGDVDAKRLWAKAGARSTFREHVHLQSAHAHERRRR